MSLPLELTTLERHMLFDDRPGYPMNCFIGLHFSGRLHVAALDAALEAVLERHPLFRANVREVGRQQEWAPSPVWPAIRAVSRCDGAESDGTPTMQAWCPVPATMPIDLRREPGLRLWAVEEERGFRLLMQFHHACCDAVGVFGFLEDLLTAYATGGDGAASRRALDEETLRQRDRFAVLSGPWHEMVRQWAVRLARVWRFGFHKPMTLGAPVSGEARKTLPDGYPTIDSRQLTADESSRLREAAARQGATLNDLLMRDWFIAVWDWQTRHFLARRGRPLRLCVPMNLRTEEHDRLPAANVISMAFVERRAKELADPERLLQGLHHEMALTKRLRLGPAFVLSIGLLEKIPHRLLHAIDPGGCWASGVLTNLGVVFKDSALPKRADGRLEIGDAVLERIEALPPLRPATHAAFTAISYAGQLSLTLHYDSRAIDRVQAADLIDSYMRQLRSSQTA